MGSRFANATVSDSAANEHTGDALVETVPSDGDDLTFAGVVAIMNYSSGNARLPPHPNASMIMRQ
jgi:hypothetical protein